MFPRFLSHVKLDCFKLLSESGVPVIQNLPANIIKSWVKKSHAFLTKSSIQNVTHNSCILGEITMVTMEIIIQGSLDNLKHLIIRLDCQN